MEARDPELKKELHATLQTRRELGEEYDSVLVESFLEKVEQRLDATVDRRVRRRLAEERTAAVRGGRDSLDGWGERFGFALVSLILAVPLSAIAVVNAGLLGLTVAWTGIIAVNAVHARHGLFTRPRRNRDTDWSD
ncbi:hypothetical protein RCO28_33885 [Streptomyces sp. LHD-70]|uniref:hypothetical protein n=1 Tax=Streptomyces sp. LHD-70 TaxID=3072140 RepID=UPI0028102564|nr:hypothetical protein [Streptomyces sp. LHD-70]MDQ8707422.1 hypothetical protein [Streptomyces sp. LHD-70]